MSPSRATSDACPLCDRPLPPYEGRGRPRLYCDEVCRSRARTVRAIERIADRIEAQGNLAEARSRRETAARRRAFWAGRISEKEWLDGEKRRR